MQNEPGLNINIADLLKKAMDTFEKIRQETKSQSVLNVLILGQTGVGKSTLINTIFGKEVAESGTSEPITQEFDEYTNKEGLKIVDSKGLEIKDSSISEDIEKYLDSQNRRPQDEQIHIVWLCIPEPSRRLQEAEIELYKKLQARNFPTIVVITKANKDKENGESFKEFVQTKLKLKEEYLQRTQVSDGEPDEDGNKTETRGIDELLEKSYKLLPEGKQNALKRHQIFNHEVRKKAKIEHAQSIINKYATAASTTALAPIPFSDMALITTTQVAMVMHINRIFGLKVAEGDTMKIVAAIAATIGAGFGWRMLAQGGGNLLKFIPVLGTIPGTMVNAAIAYSGTKIVGNSYVAFIEKNWDHFWSAFNNMSNATEFLLNAVGSNDMKDIIKQQEANKENLYKG